MTREAKIGMLTGLGVIVVIGVLLSEYLGDRNTGPSTAAGVTGRMAPLPVGAAYREQVLSPVSVPAMTPAGGGERTQLAGGGMVASPISGMPPTMYAVDSGAGSMGPVAVGPSVVGPVAPIPAGPTLMDGGSLATSSDGPPTFRLAEMTVPVKVVTPTDNRTQADNKVKMTSTTYVIANGDTLAKIAKKFYGTSKNSDVDRIVKANPGVLKDAGSMLVVNRKLTIMLPATPVAAVPTVPAVPEAPKPLDPGMVGIPSGTDIVVPLPGVVQPPSHILAVTPKPDPKPEVVKAKTYVVQSGDTLEKIARKLAPTRINETMGKLASLNAIKDTSKLKVGQTLKLPA